jgi:hypothetical protein
VLPSNFAKLLISYSSLLVLLLISLITGWSLSVTLRMAHYYVVAPYGVLPSALPSSSAYLILFTFDLGNAHGSTTDNNRLILISLSLACHSFCMWGVLVLPPPDFIVSQQFFPMIYGVEKMEAD